MQQVAVTNNLQGHDDLTIKRQNAGIRVLFRHCKFQPRIIQFSPAFRESIETLMVVTPNPNPFGTLAPASRTGGRPTNRWNTDTRFRITLRKSCSARTTRLSKNEILQILDFGLCVTLAARNVQQFARSVCQGSGLRFRLLPRSRSMVRNTH